MRTKPNKRMQQTEDAFRKLPEECKYKEVFLALADAFGVPASSRDRWKLTLSLLTKAKKPARAEKEVAE